MKIFGVSFVAFCVLDFIWLGFVMKDFNMRALAQIGRITDGKFDLWFPPAILVYVLMAATVAIFVVPRIGPDSTILQCFLWGALMGLLVYGVFDMTNLAILRDYPVHFAAVDISWGCVVFGTVTALVKVLNLIE